MEGASTSGRAKPLASVELAKHLLHFLWVCDEYIFKHPRIRLQLSFAILVMMYQGLRPGEFIECSSQRGLNEGFTYQDFALQAQPGSHGEKRRWVLQITVRLRKNHRGNQRDNVTHILTDEPGNPHLCPVTHFCALAFADGAFQNLRSPEDLNRVKTGATVRIKDSAKHTSVLRRLDQAGHVSPTLVFGADSLNFYLNGLGERAGYRDNLTAYAFRHGHGNKLDQMLSSVQRRQRMGHKSDDTFQYYISRISGVDTQSIMLGREPRQELMDHPIPVPDQDPLPETNLRVLYPEAMTERRAFDIWRTQRKINLRRRRTVHFEEQDELGHLEEHDASDVVEEQETLRSEDTASSRSQDTTNPYTVVRTGPSPYLLSVMRYEPARATFIRYFSSNNPPTLAEGIAPLQTLADPTPSSIFYPGAHPNEDGCCRHCERDLRRLPKARANRHLLACMQNILKSEAGRKVSDLTPPLESIDKSGKAACRWSCCTYSFGSSKASGIADHVTQHIKSSRDSVCWWNECKFSANSKTALATHLLDCHSLFSAVTLPTDVNFCYECGEWVESKTSWDSHCEAHMSKLSSLGPFCGQIVRYGVVIVVAKCVFCLGKIGTGFSRRFHQFADCYALHAHIDSHLSKVKDWPLVCPHPYCDYLSVHVEGFWLHLVQSHGIEARVVRPKRNRPVGQPVDPLQSQQGVDMSDDESAMNQSDSLGRSDGVDNSSLSSVDIADDNMHDLSYGIHFLLRAVASSIRAIPYVAYILIGRTLSGGNVAEIGCIVVGSQALVVSRFFLNFVVATCLLLLQTQW
ncbi:hypothetical protein D6C77_08997 [Aureobasidium pullulans]|nr:hypothetical protein D6C77_08997 [Aureobasidium pullulans]